MLFGLLDWIMVRWNYIVVVINIYILEFIFCIGIV